MEEENAKGIKGKYGEYTRQYWYIFIVGMFMLAMGIGWFAYSLLILKTSVQFIAGVLFDIGLTLTVIGIAGYFYEKKNYGRAKIKTEIGQISFILGLIAFFAFPVFLLSLTLGAVAIWLGRVAIGDGDNTYGKDGFYIGTIAVIVELLLFFLTLLTPICFSLFYFNLFFK